MSTVSCVTLGTYVQEVCPDWQKTGIDSFAIIYPDAAIVTSKNYDIAADWTTDINNSKIFVIPAVSGSLVDPAKVEFPNPVKCGPDNIAVGWTQGMIATDAHVSQFNNEFHQDVNRIAGYIGYRFCENDNIEVWDKSLVYFNVSPANSTDAKGLRVYNITANWSGDVDEFPVIYDEPTGIFG